MLSVLLAALLLNAWQVQPAERAYLVDDPVNPARIGLVTHEGRYSGSFADDCATPLASWQNVLVWPSDDDASVYVVALNSSAEPCLFTGVPMTYAGCFTDMHGDCDVATELAP